MDQGFILPCEIKLQQERIEYISMIGSYTFKKEKKL